MTEPQYEIHPCAKCSTPMADHERKSCSTCQRPAQQRAGFLERIERYAERAALGLPLFGSQT